MADGTGDAVCVYLLGHWAYGGGARAAFHDTGCVAWHRAFLGDGFVGRRPVPHPVCPA